MSQTTSEDNPGQELNKVQVFKAGGGLTSFRRIQLALASGAF